ncbi:UNVERIFIED_CONTAM: hypothetical protein FKN15_018473, partial [Acipenser sinensis]
TETTTNLNQKLFYHVIGTSQSEDILVAEFPDHPKWHSSATVSDDGRYVLLSITEGCEPVNRLWYCDLQQLSGGITGILPWVKLVDNFEAQYSYVTNEGSAFTFRTNLLAPRYRLINIDLQSPDPSLWTTLIPEHEKDVLGIIYHCDLTSETPEPTVFRQVEVKGFDPSDYQPVFQRVFYPSRDGTKIPMFLVHATGITLDSSHPVFLYGYGGFEASIQPYYKSVSQPSLKDLWIRVPPPCNLSKEC